MSVDITRPLMTLCDENGVPIDGVSKSTSEVEAMEKASHLGPGTYILKRPDATIEVEGEVAPVDPHPSYETSSFTVSLG